MSEASNQRKYPKVGAKSTGSIPPSELIEVVEAAARAGAEVVMDAVNKPRNVAYKGLADLVTDTDKMSEIAILEVIKKNFADHLILGEEGGIAGDTSSDYLWCVDPLDGTTNFAHCYPSFAVSVGVLFQGNPAAATVEKERWHYCFFMCRWNLLGDLCVGIPVHILLLLVGEHFVTDRKSIPVKQIRNICLQVEQSLLVTGFGCEHDDAWNTNFELFKEFTGISRGVRRLGGAAVDMCHVALGVTEGYWEYRLKPWDITAAVLIIEEAGGVVTRMDGGKLCVFDKSVLVSNGAIHAKLLERIAPATEKLKSKGIDFSLCYKPENYVTDL